MSSGGRRSILPILLASLATIVLAACGEDGALRRTPARMQASVVAAGDVASCWWRGDEATARLLDRIDGVILGLGDMVYQDGTPGQFRDCYGPTWGRHLERTRPVPGNHDYRYQDGAGYFAYFGSRAGQPGKGWYSFDVDGWHLVALNSEEPLDEGSEQIAWLREDLRRSGARCTLAYVHHPRFSSGKHGSRSRVETAWRVLYEAGVEVVLSGHDHHYERFAPQNPDGEPDPARGIRQWVVGTGGSPTYPLRDVAPGSEVRNNRVRGVLVFRFTPESYEWEFVPITGHRFADRGSARCH